MRLPELRRAEVAIPTAAMADIAFLLVIFFMLCTAHRADRTPVSLPTSDFRVDVDRNSAYVILEKPSGGDRRNELLYRFSDGKEAPRVVGGPADVYLEASRLVFDDPSRPFVIKADGMVRYRYIDEIIESLRKAGARNLLLLTRPRTALGTP